MVLPMTDTRTTSFVAVVDDDELMRGALEGLLKASDLSVRTFASAEEFLTSQDHGHAACLIADIRMPGMSGLDLQARLNAEQIPIPTIFITAHADARLRMQAMRAGAVEFLEKPFDDEVLLESVRAALPR
jgi:FixJ family two-component response regulator